MTLTQNRINQAIDYARHWNHHTHALAFELTKIDKDNVYNWERNGVYLNEILIAKLQNIEQRHSIARFLTDELFFDRSTVLLALGSLERENKKSINYKTDVKIQSQWLIDFWESNKTEILNFNN